MDAGSRPFSTNPTNIYKFIYYKTRALSCKKNYISSTTLYFLPGIEFRKINNHDVNFLNHGPPVFDTPMSDTESFSRQPKTGQKDSTASPLFRVHSFCDKEAHVALARRLRPSLFLHQCVLISSSQIRQTESMLFTASNVIERPPGGVEVISLEESKCVVRHQIVLVTCIQYGDLLTAEKTLWVFKVMFCILRRLTLCLCVTIC